MSDGVLLRSVVLAALTLATAVMLGVSVRGNYLYGASLGQTDEKAMLFGWANVAAEVWKAFGLIAASLLWRVRRRKAAAAASLAWAVCFLFGVNSALGLYVHDRTTGIGARDAQRATLKERQAELSDIEAKRARHAGIRSTGEINADIAALLGRAIVTRDRMRGTIGTVSKDCSVQDPRTYTLCEEVGRLRQELSQASDASAAEERARALRSEIQRLRDQGGNIAADPVAEFYAWLTGGGLSIRDIGFGFPLLFALLIEIVSAFGPLTIAAYAEATRTANAVSKLDVLEPAMARHGAPPLATPRRSLTEMDKDVLDWLAERAVPATSAGAIDLSDLYVDYAAWCEERAHEARAVKEFEDALDAARELPDLAGKIRKFSTRYYGVGLVAKKGIAKQARGRG